MAQDQKHERREEDEEDEDEETDESGYKTVKDAVLFAIDVSKSMLKRPTLSDDKKADKDSATSAALKCAYQLMQQRIISNPNDMMGILLFGTEDSRFQDVQHSSNEAAYPHCYLLADLNVPAASDVKRLRNLVEDESEFEKLMVPSDEPVSMANVLFCANQIFTTNAPNFSSRRLFLVTDNDDPHGNEKALRQASAVRAKDLYDLGVVIELFPISKPGYGFDRTKFYDDIVYRMTPADPDAPAPLSSAAKASSSGDGITLLQSLLSSINTKAAPRRALFNLPLEIGPGLKIGVKGYIIIKRQEPVRSCYVWLNGERAQIAVGSTTQIAEDTARVVGKTEVRKAFKFGGETVQFKPEEIAAIKNFGDPVIRIIGFKPMDKLPIWASTRGPTFVYPSETDFVGSTRVFSALHQKMVKDNKMALAWFIPRRNAAPTLAAIIAGEEKISDERSQTMPPGLWIIPLPFADDIRQNPETELARAPDELVDKMRFVVQQLQMPRAVYDPSRYPNPSLQWFYKILQAMALEEDLPDEPEDKTKPKYRQIDKRAGEYVVEWGKDLEAHYQKWQLSNRNGSGAPATKRAGTESSAKEPAKKKIKTESESADGPTDSEMKKHYVEGTLSKLTVPILKSFAIGHSIDGAKGMKKAELVDGIEGFFERK